MPRNKITDLRNHLFEVIEKLQEGDIDLDHAKAIAEVGAVLVETAKVEVQFLRTVKGGMLSGFWDDSTKNLPNGKAE